MPRLEPTPITVTTPPGRLDPDGETLEQHPSFGVVVLTKRQSTPAHALFDSSIKHNEYVHLEIYTADRRRALHRDWIHPTKTKVAISMSMAQWAQLVSSFGNGDGTSVTLEYLDGQEIPGAVHESRLAVTAREVEQTAARATEKVTEAARALREAFDRKAGRTETAKLLRQLEHAEQGLPGTMKFAAESLTKHSEKVVTKATADIEAMHMRAAQNAANQVGTVAYPRPELES